MSQLLLENAFECISKARDADTSKDYEKALALYEEGLRHLSEVIKNEDLPDEDKITYREKYMKYLARAHSLQSYIWKKSISKSSPIPSNNEESSIVQDSSILQSLSLKESITPKEESSVAEGECKISWGDVAGLDEAKELLKEAVILPVRFPHLFTKKRLSWQGILLYGPTGSGKSFLIKALANEASNSMFFSAHSSDLTSKWLGESKKLVKNLFDMARSHKPSILCIEDIDFMFCSERRDDSETILRVKTEFIRQMRHDENDGVVVIATSNIPWALDPDILLFFERRIYVPLPGTKERKSILCNLLRNTDILLSDSDAAKLAKETRGFSGSDMHILIKDALMMPIRKLQSATHFKEVSYFSREDPMHTNNYFTPCSPADRGAIEVTFTDLPSDKIMEPIVTMVMKNCSCYILEKLCLHRQQIKLITALIQSGGSSYNYQIDCQKIYYHALHLLKQNDLMKSLYNTKATVSVDDVYQFQRFIDQNKEIHHSYV